MTPGWLRWLGRLTGSMPEHLSLGVGYVLVGVAVLTSWSVFTRYVLHRPYAWTYEIGGYAFLFVCATGVGYALQQGRHIGVDLLVNRLPPRKRATVAILSLVVTLVWAVLVVWGTLSRALFSLKTGKISTTLLIPVFPFEVLVPAGMAIFVLIGLILLRRDIARLRTETPDGDDGRDKPLGGS